MFDQFHTRRRHTRLMRLAKDLIRQAYDPTNVTPSQVACLAFARHQMRIDEHEATDYLAAALVARGHHTDHHPTTDTDQH